MCELVGRTRSRKGLEVTTGVQCAVILYTVELSLHYCICNHDAKFSCNFRVFVFYLADAFMSSGQDGYIDFTRCLLIFSGGSSFKTVRLLMKQLSIIIFLSQTLFWKFYQFYCQYLAWSQYFEAGPNFVLPFLTFSTAILMLSLVLLAFPQQGKGPVQRLIEFWAACEPDLPLIQSKPGHLACGPKLLMSPLFAPYCWHFTPGLNC